MGTSAPRDYNQPPLWDTDLSDPSCSWDLGLSQQLATKLLLLDPREERRGDLCTEQSQTLSNPRYKTKLCQKYWIAGYCAYGPRCNFVHQEMEKQYRGGQNFYPEVTTTQSATTQSQPSAVMRTAGGFTRSRQTIPSALVRNVSDVIRIAKLGSQGASGGDSGSELGPASNDIWRGSLVPQG